MKLLLLTLLFCATTFMARANTIFGEGESSKTDIAGGVVDADTRKPLGNVIVTAYSISKKEKMVLTDNAGNYSFNELKPGMYKLVFEKNGFKKVTRDKVTIRSDEGCQLNIEMNDEETFQIMPGQLFTELD